MRRSLTVAAVCVGLIVGAAMAPAGYSILSAHLATRGLANQSQFAAALIAWVQQYLANGAWGGNTDSKKGAIEKLLNGSKELQQAELNMDASQEVARAYADASMMYPENNERVCRIMREESDAADALFLAEFNQKLAATEVAESNTGNLTPQTVRSVLENHYATYCSQADISQGRCQTLSKLPNADVDAATLMVPEDSATYSPEQLRAAKSFTRMATAPLPQPDLPPGFESTPAGQRYLIEQKSYEASMTMAQGAYARILAARSPAK